jgi:nucleoside-diphosphate-sugar epimerase
MESHASVTRAETGAGRNEVQSVRLTCRRQPAIRLAAEVGDDIRGTRPERRIDVTLEEIADVRGATDDASAVIDLLFSLHGAIVAHTAALATLRNSSRAAFGSR